MLSLNKNVIHYLKYSHSFIRIIQLLISNLFIELSIFHEVFKLNLVFLFINLLFSLVLLLTYLDHSSSELIELIKFENVLIMLNEGYIV